MSKKRSPGSSTIDRPPQATHWLGETTASNVQARWVNDGDLRGMQLHTQNLTLLLQSTEEILAWVDSLGAATRAEISPDWLARIRTATSPDPWTHGFAIMHRASGAAIGNRYKSPSASRALAS